MDLSFSKNLRFLRVSQNLRQSDIDSAIGLGKNAISNYELGRISPTIETLIKIADYFGVTTDALLRSDMSEVGIGASLSVANADKEIKRIVQSLENIEHIINLLKQKQ